MASLEEKFKKLAKGDMKLDFDPLANDEAKLLTIRLIDIEPDPNQPRKNVGDLAGLKGSIKQHGIVQPLLVSPIDDNHYRLIAGERRYTAARELNLTTVPVLVRTVKDHHRLELQLIENLHRKDLDPFEEATGYQRLADEFNLTHEDIAQQISKSRTHVTQTLSLNKIPVETRQKCQSSDIPLSRDTLYLIAKQNSHEKMDEVMQLAFKRLTYEERRNQARKGKPRTETAAKKPKQVFNTSQEATVIVQSRTADLSTERIIVALEEALRQAKG